MLRRFILDRLKLKIEHLDILDAFDDKEVNRVFAFVRSIPPKSRSANRRADCLEVKERAFL